MPNVWAYALPDLPCSRKSLEMPEGSPPSLRGLTRLHCAEAPIHPHLPCEHRFLRPPRETVQHDHCRYRTQVAESSPGFVCLVHINPWSGQENLHRLRIASAGHFVERRRSMRICLIYIDPPGLPRAAQSTRQTRSRQHMAAASCRIYPPCSRRSLRPTRAAASPLRGLPKLPRVKV